MVCVLGLQQQYKDFVKTLINVQAAIVVVHEWTMRYEGAPLNLGKKMKPQAKLEKARVRMLIHNNKQLASFIGNIQASYARIYNTLDSLVKTHKIPLVGSLTEAKHRNQVRNGGRGILGAIETDCDQGGLGGEHTEHAQLHWWPCPSANNVGHASEGSRNWFQNIVPEFHGV